MDIKLQLVSQSPIIFDNIKIFQITFGEIEEIGINTFDELLLPYLLTLDMLKIPEEEQSNYNLFDIVISDPYLQVSLLTSLKYFCKTNNIFLTPDSIKINNGILHRYNFDDFTNIICKIIMREKSKIEKSSIVKSERQKEIDRKLEQGRRRNAKNNELHLYDILNVCEFYRYYIPMDEIKKWTLFKIMQCYKVKIGESSWNDNFNIYLVSGEKTLIEKHWTDLIKVDYKFTE